VVDPVSSDIGSTADINWQYSVMATSLPDRVHPTFQKFLPEAGYEIRSHFRLTG
jgi:hypothetical protein